MTNSKKEEVNQKIRDTLSWNGFDEDVIEPIYKIFDQLIQEKVEKIEESFKEDEKNRMWSDEYESGYFRAKYRAINLLKE